MTKFPKNPVELSSSKFRTPQVSNSHSKNRRRTSPTAITILSARFSTVKNLDAFDFKARPAVD
jgi:hypothetical protein